MINKATILQIAFNPTYLLCAILTNETVCLFAFVLFHWGMLCTASLTWLACRFVLSNLPSNEQD